MAELLPPEQAGPLLDEFFAETLPITKYLNMRLHEYTGDKCSLAIDLNPSVNDKMTAFGGSLYCVSVMNCWGMVYLQGRQRGINPNMVVSHAEIDYLAPVDDEVIIATCYEPDDADWDGFFESFHNRGKARAKVSSSIWCRGKEAVRFNGQYAIIGIID
ncbi:MAG: YiiD C-terminal domain-containing protein [Oceanicoccus sp.]|uniref:YiiD C-terminal domain-containing protein n=1 Tax=Oceanicoccus sp. TaxID=2691044 RepID=UPI00260FFAB5|nr:YiiD C-terminal domain-containing protein [Oceanicoccus sp.]MDG1772047.1 YiiD C-terminal domain-containing protein [Oceanicoccus sp.]